MNNRKEKPFIQFLRKPCKSFANELLDEEIRIYFQKWAAELNRLFTEVDNFYKEQK